MLINANREGTAVMEGLSDSDAVLSPMTEMGKKGLSRKSLRPWYNSKEDSVKLTEIGPKYQLEESHVEQNILAPVSLLCTVTGWVNPKRSGLGVDIAVDGEVRLTAKDASCSKFSQRSEQ